MTQEFQTTSNSEKASVLMQLDSLANMPEGDTTVVRILSYNIRHGQGLDGRVDLARIATVVRRLNADIVALQEVDQGCSRSGEVHQADELGRMLSMAHVFGKTLDLSGGEYGLAVLSRLPILGDHCHPLPCDHEPRCALETVVQVGDGGGRFRLVSLHAAYAAGEDRLAQMRSLHGLFGGTTEATVITGDFNATRDEPPLLYVQEQGWCISPKQGAPETFPADVPTREIDFAVTPPLSPGRITSCRVADEMLASDHRPVVSEVVIPSREEACQDVD
jgi:endonuclease/exonuclease/phosphatase family metal-dependent hydrolase